MSSLSGIKNGSSVSAFVIPVDNAGKISFDVWLVDSRGSSSNRLSGSIDVVAGPAPEHPPQISGLNYSPAMATQAANGTVSVNVGVVFADKGGDVNTMRITSSAGADLTVPLPALSGIQNGTTATTLMLPVDKVGRVSFAVWLVDARGGTSNSLAGGVDVVVSMPSDAWIRLPATPPATLFGVAWDGLGYVAVGAGGTVMTAADLNGWSVQTSGVAHTLRSVAGRRCQPRVLRERRRLDSHPVIGLRQCRVVEWHALRFGRAVNLQIAVTWPTGVRSTLKPQPLGRLIGGARRTARERNLGVSWRRARLGIE